MDQTNNRTIIIIPTLPIEEGERLFKLWCEENKELLGTLRENDLEKELIRGGDGKNYMRVHLLLHADNH